MRWVYIISPLQHSTSSSLPFNMEKCIYKLYRGTFFFRNNILSLCVAVIPYTFCGSLSSYNKGPRYLHIGGGKIAKNTRDMPAYETSFFVIKIFNFCMRRGLCMREHPSHTFTTSTHNKMLTILVSN